MIGEQQRRVDVESRVRKELERIDLYRPPVNPVTVANKLGMRVMSGVFKDSSVISMVSIKGGNSGIFVAESKSDAPYLLRVAVAHALGHYFLHLLKDGVTKDGKILDRHIDMFWEREPDEGPLSKEHLWEIEANQFASELLMPEKYVKEEWGKKPNILSMAQTFGVTEEAIGQRIANLALWIPKNKA